MTTLEIARQITRLRHWHGNDGSDLAMLTSVAEGSLIGSLMLFGLAAVNIAGMKQISALVLTSSGLCITVALFIFVYAYYRSARARDFLLKNNISNLDELKQ